MPVASHALRLGVVLLVLISGLSAVDSTDLRARMALVRQLALEANNRDLIAAAERLIHSGDDPANMDTTLRDLERQVGITPGGWAVDGLALFKPAPEDATELPRLQQSLATALAAQDAAAITTAASAWKNYLGNRAGLPDARRPGWHPTANAPVDPPTLEHLLRECAKKSPLRQALLDRQPLPKTMIRVYAYMLDALIEIRSAAVKHRPEAVTDLDRLLDGTAGILIDLQRPEGYWPFPDVRDSNARFGGMIDDEIDATGNRVEHGWLIDPVRNGGSYFDTGLAGQALLRAGAALNRTEWSSAGQRAATWCAHGALSTNWNYNAFAAGLCADAARLGGGPDMLQAAVRFIDLGVLPGQLIDGANRGRWMDPHNARSVYHVILLRGLHDVLTALPADHMRRPAITAAARMAVMALIYEQQAAGVTVICLHELSRHAALVSDADPRLAMMQADQRAAASVRIAGGTGARIAFNEIAWWMASEIKPAPEH